MGKTFPKIILKLVFTYLAITCLCNEGRVVTVLMEMRVITLLSFSKIYMPSVGRVVY